MSQTETERFQRAFIRQSIRRAGIPLVPVKSKMKGYYLCQECGDYIQEVGLVEQYTRHWTEKHPQKMKATA